MEIFLLKTSLDKLCKNTGFTYRILPYKDRIIMSLYGRIWVSENPYSRLFHVLHITDNNIDPHLTHFLQ